MSVLGEAITILHTDPQYASRFDVVNLPKWELNQDFLRLLVSYVRLLPLKKQSNLASKEIATLIFEVFRWKFGRFKSITGGVRQRSHFTR